MQEMATTVVEPVYPTCQQFAAQVGTLFTVDGGNGNERGAIGATTATSLTLTSVVPHERGADPADASRAIRSFSVNFSSCARPHLAQGCYALRHAALGTLDIFIVPLGPDAGGMRYEAVFNFIPSVTGDRT